MYTVQYTGSIGSHHVQDAFPIGLYSMYIVHCTVQTLSPLPYIEQMQRYMSGVSAHISGIESRHIPLLVVQP